MQKEVAERVAAKPGEMSLLSVSVQLQYGVELGKIAPAKLFEPPPKVDSQILILKLREKPLFKQLNEPKFFRVVKAGFSSRRKTILNSLSGGLRLSREETEKLIEKAGLKATSRPQELSLNDWHRLTEVSEYT
jgi:16S rRNA (adenine1518-N6/adenine1519-N6)-dimethyltransferase